MGLLTRALVAAALTAGCGPKALRVVEAPDVPADAFDASDASPADVRDVAPPDVAPPDARADVAPGPSCADDPSRPDCARVTVAATAPFCVGLPAAAANAAWNASPPLCGVTLSAFAVDAREVTAGRFRPFFARWAAGSLPAWREARFANGVAVRVPLAPRTVLSEWSPAVVGCTWSETPDAARDLHPLNCVGWTLAMYFCAWEGGHLLTSTEYEYLARWHGAAAGEDRAFPWGAATPACERVHYGPCVGDDGLETRRAGSLAPTAGGVFDLAGNVADLVADDFAPYATLAASPCWGHADPLCQPTLAGTHYARGGSHQNDSEALLRAVFRTTGGSGDASPARGFRCAYPLP